MIFFDYLMSKVKNTERYMIFVYLLNISGEDVNVRAIVSSLQETTRVNSKSKHVLPTRMLKKTKQIKHVCMFIFLKTSRFQKTEFLLDEIPFFSLIFRQGHIEEKL